jgi:hypothetical protein
MPLAFTTVPPRRRWARWRWCRAGGRKQVRGMVDWTHVGSIGVGGSAGEVPGDGRWRGSGGASVAARIPAKCGAKLGLVWMWELEWRLGRSIELSVDHRHKRRRDLTGKQQWRAVAECGDVRAGIRPMAGRACERRRVRGVWRPRFSTELINPNEQVNCFDFGQTTVNLGHHPENITNNP